MKLTSYFRLLALAFLLATSARAATLWVKPTGTGSANGTSEANAVGNSGVMALASPGDTLNYLSEYGTYSSIHITVEDVVLRSTDSSGNFKKWAAKVTGSAGTHAIYTDDGVDGVTILGFHVQSAYIDGIKNNGNRCTNRYNWVVGAGRGNPSWTTNTTGLYTGNGIACHNKSDFDISYNRVENCGANLTQDHLFYGGGTNGRIHGNWFGTNQCGWGVQIYDSTGDNQNIWVTENLIHDTGTVGATQGGLVIYTYGAKTNFILGNTIVTRGNRYGMIMNQANTSARIGLTNNIVVGNSGYGVTLATGAAGTNGVWSNYNLKSAILSNEPQGANDVAGTPLFDSESSARYWPAPTSPARNMALATGSYGTDFWGRTRLKVYDVGAFQFEDMLANDDTRNLGDAARDPWVREGLSLTVVPSKSAHEVRWLEPNDQHAGYYVQRKDSVGGTYGNLAFVARGTTFYADPVSSMTNGLTYTYTLTPETSLGNSGGIHSIPVAVVCDKLSTIHPARLLSYGTNITGLPNGTYPAYSIWASNIAVSIPGTNRVVVGDGVTDNTIAFLTAIALCPSNSYIDFPAGYYVVSNTIGFFAQSLSLNNNRVLRGAGTNSSYIVPAATGFGGSTVLQLGVFNEQGTERTVSAALPKGSTTLNLPGGLGAIPIQVGTILKIWENPAGGVFGATSGGGNADPVYNSNDGSTLIEASAPLVRDTVMVTGISGFDITFDPPLINSYSANARVQYQYLYMCNNSGFEGFTVDNTTAQVSRILTWEGTARSWIKGMRFVKANAAHIRAQMNVRMQMENCFMHDAAVFTANAGIGLQLLRDCDSGLFINNVFSKLFPMVEYQKASDGNFFAGNYYTNPQGGLAPIDNHGGHNTFNAHEHEEFYGVVMDGYFNSAADWWFYRCFGHGSQSTFGARKIFNFSRFSRRMNVMNCVVGYPGTNWVSSSTNSGYSNADAYIARFGYPNMGNDTHTGLGTTYRVTDPGKIDIGVMSNMTWHANFTHDTNSISYDPALTNRTAPYSLFAQWNSSTAPAWWGTNLWPSIGVDGGTVLTNDIPAKRWATHAVAGAAPSGTGVLSSYDDEPWSLVKWFFFY